MGAAVATGLASKPPGVGAFVPANELVLAPKRLATLGFGREVRRSEAVKAAERSARDFGFSSSYAAGAGGGVGCEGAAEEP